MARVGETTWIVTRDSPQLVSPWKEPCRFRFWAIQDAMLKAIFDIPRPEKKNGIQRYPGLSSKGEGSDWDLAQIICDWQQWEKLSNEKKQKSSE